MRTKTQQTMCHSGEERAVITTRKALGSISSSGFVVGRKIPSTLELATNSGWRIECCTVPEAAVSQIDQALELPTRELE
jgi:hypothetical protein